MRSATASSQDDVGDVWGARWRVDARLGCVQLDREAVAEQPAEVVGTDVVGWVDASRLHVLPVLVVEVVVHGEQLCRPRANGPGPIPDSDGPER